MVSVARAPIGSFVTILLLSAFLAGCNDSSVKVAGVPEKIDYNWDVRPILSDNCFACHGKDAAARKAGLRLDMPESAYSELPEAPGKHAIVRGKPSSSELVRRINEKDPKEHMPPPASHKVLTDTQIAILTKWIDEGAEYKAHWAFIVPKKPSVPRAGKDWAVNEIDRFVSDRLAHEGLKPSPEADKETLINRVSLTLTGLPPTLDEVDAFLADKSSNAYEKVVDHLLQSTAYAERQATEWMDVSRWSDSDGYGNDMHGRLAYPWRDWVIDAFHNNMPFNKFGTLQIAGDLTTDHPGKNELVPTVWLRLAKRQTEGGAIPEEFRVENMIDRANTVGTAFLGLTVGCARCHDHKYDPISQKDFYSFAGFFSKIDEPGVYPQTGDFVGNKFYLSEQGPTLPWTDKEATAKIEEAEKNLEKKRADYQLVLTSVSGKLATAASALASQEPPKVLKAIEQSLEEATVAYYPFETTRPVTEADLPLNRPRPPPKPAAPGAPARKPPVIPNGYVRDQLVLSPSVMGNGPSSVGKARPAVLQSPIFKDGPRGKAIFFDSLNKGYLGLNVGRYDRTQPFSFDLWFYPGKRYEYVAPIVNHAEGYLGGGTGYNLQLLEDGRLHFYLAHSTPADMISMATKTALPLNQWSHITVTYDGTSKAAGTKIYIDGEEAVVDVDHDTLTRALLLKRDFAGFDEIVGLTFGTKNRVKAAIDSGLDEIRVFSRELTPIEVSVLHNPAGALNCDQGPLKAIATSANADCVAALTRAVLPFVTVTNEDVARARAELTEADQAHNLLLSDAPELMVMRDADVRSMGMAMGPKAYEPHRLNRGLYNDPREEVPIQALDQIFKWDESLPRNRLGLAQWIFDPKNPLTARVIVNRMWLSHFGAGIVKTAEDFGAQSSAPTHPELLDWLAVHFVESGWNIRELHKLIVMSATYRQSSNFTEELLQRDPSNQILARGPRLHMTAEMVRDGALAVSGLLKGEVGGPSTYPYQPEGVWGPLQSFHPYPKMDQVPPDDFHRRSLYSFVKRNAPHPMMTAFDFPDRNVSTARRRVSNSPAQALSLLNNPQFIEASRVLAQNTLDTTPDMDARLVKIFRTLRRVKPTDEQLAILRDLYTDQQGYFEKSPDGAREYERIGIEPGKEATDPVQLAALTAVVSTLMSAPETYMIH